ncbi:MAG: InlB B-repeat-containing protein, partial [Candidatus Fimimonas sp.]
MPTNTNSGAAFTVDGKTVMGNTSSLTKYIATGGSVVVRELIVNMGAFGNYPLANLYYSSSASTNFVRCSTGSGYTITQPGKYYFVTIVDCYSSAAHTSITKSYRSSSVLCIEVKSADLPVAPTKTGYTFTGWYTDSACTKPYEEDTITSDITLYAGFRPNTYTIVFNGNGNTSGSMSNLSMTYDVAKNLTANAFVRTGYKFDGWATSSGGSVAYADKASVKNLTAEDGATINLYAHWTLVDYTVHFNGNGNTSGSMTNQTLTRDIA